MSKKVFKKPGADEPKSVLIDINNVKYEIKPLTLRVVTELSEKHNVSMTDLSAGLTGTNLATMLLVNLQKHNPKNAKLLTLDVVLDLGFNHPLFKATTINLIMGVNEPDPLA